MHVDHALGTGLFVQIVDVLRADGNGSAKRLPRRFQSRQRQVRRVRLHLAKLAAPQVVELQHAMRIALITLDAGHFLDREPFPKPVFVAECRKSGLGRNAGASEDENLTCVQWNLRKAA